MSNDTDTAESTKDSADDVGLEEAGFESRNNSREETEAIMKADSPDDIDQELLEEIENERKERLDPDNRPPNAEVDNTQRTFIAEEARFEDSEVDAEDGIGQKEPDPETQAGSSDDAKNQAEDEDTSTDTDVEGEATAQAADSDASTGPRPDDAEPGRHKA